MTDHSVKMYYETNDSIASGNGGRSFVESVGPAREGLEPSYLGMVSADSRKCFSPVQIQFYEYIAAS